MRSCQAKIAGFVNPFLTISRYGDPHAIPQRPFRPVAARPTGGPWMVAVRASRELVRRRAIPHRADFAGAQAAAWRGSVGGRGAATGVAAGIAAGFVGLTVPRHGVVSRFTAMEVARDR